MSTAAAPARGDRRWVWLAGVLLLALVLRLPGLFEGPGTMNRDELMYVPKAVRYGGGDLNPHYFQNPPLASYFMLVALGVQFAAGWIGGAWSGAIEYKAAYLADPGPAFIVARTAPLLFGLGTVALTFALARRLFATTAPQSQRTLAGTIAAVLLAASPGHVERSAMATNESLAAFMWVLAALGALRFVRTGTLRDAALAGVAAGLCAASKYTGAVVCAAPAVACFVQDVPLGRRVRLAMAAGAAAITAFVVACPWAVLDATTFRAHILDLFQARDRGPELAAGDALARSVREYVSWIIGPGLGPVGAALAAIGVVGALLRTFRGPPDERRAAVVLLAAGVPLVVYLARHTQMANGRYLLPVCAPLLALGAAESVRRVSGLRWGAVAVLAACVVSIPIAHADFPERVGRARARDTQTVVAAWLRAHVPDGAHVVTDWHGPRLAGVGARKEFEGRVSPATWALLVPGYRLTMAFDYFALPVNTLTGTSVRVDDLGALAAHAPVWFVQSEEMEAIFPKLPPADYPAMRWYDVTRSLPVVHEVLPGEGLRGPAFRIRVLR